MGHICVKWVAYDGLLRNQVCIWKRHASHPRDQGVPEQITVKRPVLLPVDQELRRRDACRWFSNPAIGRDEQSGRRESNPTSPAWKAKGSATELRPRAKEAYVHIHRRAVPDYLRTSSAPRRRASPDRCVTKWRCAGRRHHCGVPCGLPSDAAAQIPRSSPSHPMCPPFSETDAVSPVRRAGFRCPRCGVGWWKDLYDMQDHWRRYPTGLSR